MLTEPSCFFVSQKTLPEVLLCFQMGVGRVNKGSVGYVVAFIMAAQLRFRSSNLVKLFGVFICNNS